VDPVTLGWKLFVLGQNKTPLPNCPTCADAGPEHDREACDHLTCHGIYAATSDEDRWHQMMARFPEHPWAVRCGEVSGIVVIDAEGTPHPQNGLTGVDVLDDFENWTSFPLTRTELAAETPSGGIHLFYRYPGGVRSRNRVLPQVDIKSDGGYVVIPTIWTMKRRWLRKGEPAEPDPRLVDWLRTTRGRSTGGLAGPVGHADGYDFERFVREGCPGGMRDEFFNDLIFRLRKAGVDRAIAQMKVREAWKRCQQPDTGATWYLPWWNCEYKIEKVWRTVAPDPEPDDDQLQWARAVQVAELSKVGRVTLAPRGSR